MDNLTPPTPPEARRITAQEPPQFPCWLWNSTDCNGHWWKVNANDATYIKNLARFTHWHPDQPTAPTQPPAPLAGGTALQPSTATAEVAAGCKEGRPVSPATANDTIYGIPEIDGPITIPASVPKLDYTPPVAGKELIIFINSDAEGMGNHANSRESAIQWFASYLDTLSDGDSDDIRIERRDMTKAELDALPEQ